MPRSWKVITDESDHRGLPAVVCRHAGREFYFCRGFRGGRDVWICWERCRLILGTVLQPPPQKDAEGAALAAASQLSELEPTFPVYLDLATEEPEDLGCFLDPKSGGTAPS
ncbi:MAG: hypothetical protein U1G08_04965 [Verrucomicrobiota bacterium]